MTHSQHQLGQALAVDFYPRFIAEKVAIFEYDNLQEAYVAKQSFVLKHPTVLISQLFISGVRN